MGIFTKVCTTTVRPHMEYASNAWSSAARTNLDQLTKTRNWTENYHRWYEGHPQLRGGKYSGTAVIRRKKRGKTSAPKQKDEDASFTPITFQV